MQGRIVRDPIDCAHCGVTFTPHRYNQRFCSVDHQVTNYRKHNNVNFVRTMIPCAYCGKEFLQFRKFHKCCSEHCANTWYRKRTTLPPMSNQDVHRTRLRMSFARIPDELIDVIDDVIAYKLTLSSDLLTTRRVLALALKRRPTPINNVERESLNDYINKELERHGGVLDPDFKNSVDRTTKDTAYPGGAIYRMKVRA